ncbi:hypothetical protein OH723_27015 [Streptomyces albidoflavus]|uniref:hypothetical protein n=1 Tax=Streptomyces albidoflavus TaxID=1886 RepID=UPI00386977E3|nr:hypothetical protein OH723_27015 [Streptomyces albidoflavus]
MTAPAAADRGLPPSFRRFWASAAAANVADGIRAGALPLIGAAVSPDAFPVALIAACQQGAWLVFGLGAGLAADRLPPARLVAAAELLRVVVLSSLLFATAMFVPLAVDASALAVAVILVLTLPTAASTVAAPPAREERPRLLTELLGGARRLLGHPRLAVATCAASAIAFADAAWWSVLVVYSGSVLGLPEAGFGLLLAAGVAVVFHRSGRPRP